LTCDLTIWIKCTIWICV